MKKIILAGVAGLIAIGSAVAATPTLSELRQLEKEGKAFKMGRKISTRQDKGFKLLNSRTDNSSLLPSTSRKNQKNLLKSDPSRLTARGVNLYGYLSYTLNNEMPGMYEFTEDGYDLFWKDPMVALGGPQAMEGWYVDGQYWGISYTNFMGYMVNYDEFIIDFEAGQLISYESHLYDASVMFVNVAMNPDDDKVYGFAFDYDIDGNIYWASADRDFIADAVSIKPANDFYCYALAYNPEDGYFYGVTDEQKFIRISTEGNYIELADLNGYNFAEYVTGMIYSQEIGGFYWAAYFNDDTSALAILSPTGNVEFVEEFSWGPNFTALITTDEYEVNPDKPGRPEIDSINFTDGNLKGTVEYTLPKRLLTGDKFPENTTLSYVALLDNEFYSMGTGKPGDQITIEYDVKEKGYHTFGLTATYNRVSGFTAEQEKWIGNDTPFAPTGVTLTKTEVSWNPVITTGIHGGYVDPSRVTYSVYINGELQGTTKSTSMGIELPEDKPFTAYKASVTAEFDGMTGAAGSSNYVAAGEALPLPFFMQPTPEEFRLFTVLDENHDGITWNYNTSNQGVGINPSNPGDKVNDYVFLPPIEFPEADNFFSIAFQAGCWISVSTRFDYLEVVWATEPSADMVGGVIMPSFTPNAGRFENIEALWKAPQPGTYYIGFRCTSEADQNGIIIKNFNITESAVNNNSPAAPEIVSAVAGKNGELKAEITVKLPTLTYGGAELPATAELTAHIQVNSSEATVVSGKPGEEVKATVETLQGENSIMVYLTDGSLESPKATTMIYTGVTVPATPKNTKMTVSEDMMTATLTWNPVTEPEEAGGYVDPEDVLYAIYVSLNFGFGDQWRIYDDNIKDTTYTLELDNSFPQALYRLGVASYNEAGTNGYLTAPSGQIMGPAYALPFAENLEDPDIIFDTTPWFMETKYNGVSYEGYWATDVMGNIGYLPGEDQPVVIGFTYSNNSKGLMSMPRITTKGVAGADFSITCLTGYDIAKLTVYGTVYGSNELIEIGTIDATNDGVEELKTYSLTLPESLLGQDWVGIYLMAEYKGLNEIFAFTNISITGNADVNTVISAEGAIFGGENVITVIGHEDDTLTVSTLDGRVIISTTADSDRAVISMAKGIYVVSAGQQTAKVIVR